MNGGGLVGLVIIAIEEDELSVSCVFFFSSLS